MPMQQGQIFQSHVFLAVLSYTARLGGLCCDLAWVKESINHFVYGLVCDRNTLGGEYGARMRNPIRSPAGKDDAGTWTKPLTEHQQIPT